MISKRCEYCGRSMGRTRLGVVICGDCSINKPAARSHEDIRIREAREIFETATRGWAVATLEREQDES